MSILDKLAARARVRVYKSAPRSDDRATLCGEELQQGKNADGEDAEFWEIPAHQADYINGAFNQYTVSEPFIPGEEPTGNIEKSFACTHEGCDFVAKSAFGLQTHARSHDK
jgi:hypothetical protein